MKAVLKAAVLLVVVAAIALFVVFMWIGSRGISARAEPGAFETFFARTMRRLAVPSGERDRTNPVKATPEVIDAALERFADHCATCHANDGSGDSEIGRGMYPKPPDLRRSGTQSLSDGELFQIIKNGVRFTGMPSWAHEDDDENWELVHFIRELPKLTPAQLEKMNALNRSPRDEQGTTGDQTAQPADTHPDDKH